MFFNLGIFLATESVSISNCFISLFSSITIKSDITRPTYGYSLKDLSRFFLVVVQYNDHDLAKETTTLFLERHFNKIAMLSRFDEMIPHLLRYSVLISEEATIKFLSLIPESSTILRSAACRDFVMGCNKRKMSQVAPCFLPERLEAKIAAEKGPALQAALRMLNAEKQNPDSVKGTKAQSSQSVVLLPQVELVVKKMHARASEDEAIVSCLLNLCKERTALPVFQIKTFLSERFGFYNLPIDWKFKLSDFESAKVFTVAEKVTVGKEKYLQVTARENQLFRHHTKGKEEFDELSGQSWQYRKDKEWVTVTFSQLADLFLLEKLPLTTKLRFRAKELSLTEFVTQESIFHQALDYYLKQPEYYLAPLIEAKDLKIYEKMFRTRWSIKQRTNITFKELLKHFLEGEFDDQTTITPVGTVDLPNKENIVQLAWKFLKLPLGLYTPHRHKWDIEGVSLTDVSVKPFVSGMYRVFELSAAFAEAVFARLDENSEYNTALMAEIQLYDLHGANIGVTAKKSAENALWMSRTFTVPGNNSPISFHALLRGYYEKNYSDLTRIGCDLGHIYYNGTIAGHKKLHEAIKNVQYELVFFDIDIALAETNEVHVGFFRDSNTSGHLIPLRSCLLDQPLKNYSSETIKKLTNPGARDAQMLAWLTSVQAPIYSFMKPEDQKSIQARVWEFADQPIYSLSATQNRLFSSHTTIATIREKFSKHLAKLNWPDKEAFWAVVQASLEKGQWFRPYVVKHGETLEMVANNTHTTPQELKELNSWLKTPLVEGIRLITKPNLTTDTDLARKAREKIARQLFPKATTYQIKALQERMQRRNEFLQSYHTLQTLTGTDTNKARDTLRAIVLKRSSPFLQRDKQEYWLPELDQAKTAHELDQLIDRLKPYFAPSYTALCFAMYPFLREVTTALQAIFLKGNREDKIGLFSYPLETLLSDLKKRYIVLKNASNRTPQEEDKLDDLEAILKNFPNQFTQSIERSKIRDKNGNAVFEPVW